MFHPDPVTAATGYPAGDLVGISGNNFEFTIEPGDSLYAISSSGSVTLIAMVVGAA